MTDDLMVDPPRENITGEKVVQHRFDHGIDWSVNVSHMLIAIAVVVFLLYAKPWSDDTRDPDEATQDHSTPFDGTSGNR